MIGRLRLIVLLLVLLFVGLGTWLDRIYSTSWTGPLVVALYPVAADTSPATQTAMANSRQYAATLEAFFARQSRRYGMPLERPLRFVVGNPLSEQPPALPDAAGVLQVMLFSLRVRWWNLGIDDPPGPTPTIRLYLLFYDPERRTSLPHSVGLQKGLLGIAHLFAAPHMTGSNQVVVAHELLHTLGATDKYDPARNQPVYPEGYAEPSLTPRVPQKRAELMAGRIPTSEHESMTPESLEDVVIGPRTAQEIGWTQGPP